MESFCSKRLTGEIFSDGFEDGTTNAWSTTFSDDDSLLVKQTFVYDGFGNLTSITDSGGSRTISVDPTTNRLSAATYDSVGNMTSWGSFAYQWRPTGEMRTRTGGGVNKWFAYDAGGQRIAVEDRDDGTLTLTIRDLAGNVLRVFERDGEDWSWKKDYVYRNGVLLAAKDPTGTVHFTVDHLGTPRCLTDDVGGLVAEHEYFGFGEEATSLWRDEAMKFTGHERDLEGTTDRLDDLDYMRARYYNQHLGRFLSVDPIGGSIGSTQSFNRYAYVGNSPMNFVDPFGLARRVADQDGKITFEDEIIVVDGILPPGGVHGPTVEFPGGTPQGPKWADELAVHWLRKRMAATEAGQARATSYRVLRNAGTSWFSGGVAAPPGHTRPINPTGFVGEIKHAVQPLLPIGALVSKGLMASWATRALWQLSAGSFGTGQVWAGVGFGVAGLGTGTVAAANFAQAGSMSLHYINSLSANYLVPIPKPPFRTVRSRRLDGEPAVVAG